MDKKDTILQILMHSSKNIFAAITGMSCILIALYFLNKINAITIDFESIYMQQIFTLIMGAGIFGFLLLIILVVLLYKFER